MNKLLLSFCFLCVALSPVLADDVKTLMLQADALFAGRQDIKTAEKSLSVYEKILSIDPNDYAAAWKASQACKWLGDNYLPDDRLIPLEKGEAFARKAIEIDPEATEGHFWLGVCLGRIGEEKGVLNSLFLVGPIKDEMEKVLELDPRHDGAHHVLSVLYRKAPGWPLSAGDSSKSLSHALASVEYHPTRILNRIGLAEIYMNTDRYSEAVEQLKKAIDLPLEADRIPEGKMDKERAKMLLRQAEEKRK